MDLSKIVERASPRIEDTIMAYERLVLGSPKAEGQAAEVAE